jgi:hypothetical protein
MFLGVCFGFVIVGLIYNDLKTETNQPKKELVVGTEIKWSEFKEEPIETSEPPLDDQWFLLTTIIIAS